jgi:hypothetical protein
VEIKLSTLKDLKSHIDPDPVVMGDFNTPSRQKNLKKEVLELNDP